MLITGHIQWKWQRQKKKSYIFLPPLHQYSSTQGPCFALLLEYCIWTPLAWMENHPQHMMLLHGTSHRSDHICSELNSGLIVQRLEMQGHLTYTFQFVQSSDVDRILLAVKPIFSMFDPCLSCFIKALCTSLSGCFILIIHSSLQPALVPTTLKEWLVWPVF